MGTRSRIGLETANGSVYSIYCHWDGYPSHNGKILLEHYSDPDKLRELIDLGDISTLAPILGVKCSFDNPIKGQVIAFGRDRGETDVEAKVDDHREMFFADAFECGEEYAYLLTRTGEWLVSGGYDEDDDKDLGVRPLTIEETV